MSESGLSDGTGEFFVLAETLRVFKADSLSGHPSDRALADAAGVSPTTVGDWLRAMRFPQDIGKVLIMVRMVRAAAAARGIASPSRGPEGLLDDDRWRAAHQKEAQRRAGVVSAEVKRAQAISVLATPPAGRLLGEITDPFALEVHRPVQLENSPPGLPTLPIYVPREHDTELRSVVRAAAEGNSGIAVLVGGSSTGKTRACWEALEVLRGRAKQWRLWHPIDPTRADAALRDLPIIGLRTVVWLNEAQFYLDATDTRLGERVAAGLRDLLRNPARAPVLVLATVWPQFWDRLTARPTADADPHAQARELLASHDITVPAAFTASQLEQLGEAGDPRLARAAETARDGQVIQVLAGAPELLARYRNAPPAVAALIHSAMDSRRLGAGVGLPQGFLEAAAPGYMTDAEWDALDEGWLEQALAYAAVQCKGARGPLTRIRSRPARSPAGGAAAAESDKQLADGQASIAGIPLYRLADYLDQHGRHHRKGRLPPASFWAAAAGHAFLGDQAALGDAAHARGLYRAATQLRKNAAAHGNIRAARHLIGTLSFINPTDHRPIRWAVARVLLEDPFAVARLLGTLQRAGAQEQVSLLLHRDPVARVLLEDPFAVARLLGRLRESGAQKQATALAERAAARVPLDDPRAVAELLARLQEAGARDQATALAERAAARVPLDDPFAVSALLRNLRTLGTQKQATTLAGRAAARVPLDDPRAVARLLGRLRDAGAQDQIAPLAERAAAHVPLDDPRAVAELLGSLGRAGAHEQAAALAERAAVHVPHNPRAVAELMDGLRDAGAQNQADTLAEHATAHVPINDPVAVAELLGSLRRAGAHEHAAALAERAAARVPLADPIAVARLLEGLWDTRAQKQATILLHRDPAAHVPLDDPRGVAELLHGLQEAGVRDQATRLLQRDPASHVLLEDPFAVAELLARLQEAGARDQATALAERAAALVPLDDPRAVAELLARLQEAGAQQQATTLAGRAAAHVPLDDPRAVAELLARLQEAGARDQATALAERAAAHVPLDDPRAVAELLHGLQEAGARDQATALANRLPGAGLFELFRGIGHRWDRFRFGREADGSPAQPWGWDDLE